MTSQTVAIRRVGDRVTIEGTFRLSQALAGNLVQLTTEIPVGFRARTPFTNPGNIVGSAYQATTQYRDDGVIYLVAGTASVLPTTATIYFALSWTTDKAWPVTLPGTPA